MYHLNHLNVQFLTVFSEQMIYSVPFMKTISINSEVIRI